MNDIPYITEIDSGIEIRVKAVPGASRDRIVGVLGDALKIQVSAPPEKGKANRAIATLLATALGVPEKSVELISGETNPRKRFRVDKLTAESVAKAVSIAQRS